MTIVVTGASGKLGAALLAHYGEPSDVSGWYVHAPSRSSLRRVDITDEHAVRDAFRELRPRLCIHCAAIADVDRCESDPAEAEDVNVRGTEILAAAADRHLTRLVLVSTDYVFDGRSLERYAESARPNPLQVYGRTKQAAELVTLARPRNLVVRVPLLYRAENEDQGWFRQTWNRLAAGEQVRADAHRVRQPALVDDVAASIVALAERGVDGIVHIAPRQVVTQYRWARLIADAVAAREDLVVPIEAQGTVSRPLRASLATDRLDDLGLTTPRSVETVLQDLAGH
jgi:dTDP-4-dehydrorhamnose reductase